MKHTRLLWLLALAFILHPSSFILAQAIRPFSGKWQDLTGRPDLGIYLTSTAAATIYLPSTTAASIYLPSTTAATLYQPLDSTLTTLSGLGTTGTGSVARNTSPTFAGTVAANVISATGAVEAIGGFRGTVGGQSVTITASGDVQLSGARRISSSSLFLQNGGTLTMDGPTTWNHGQNWRYTARTASATLGTADYFTDCTTGTFTITLPTAVGVTGRTYIIRNSGAGTITMATTSSQTIDGSPPGTLTTGQVLRVTSNGANWITW